MVITSPTPTPKKTGGYLGTPFRSFKPNVSNKIYIWVCSQNKGHKHCCWHTCLQPFPCLMQMLLWTHSHSCHSLDSCEAHTLPCQKWGRGLVKSSEQTNQIHSQSFFSFVAWSHYFIDRSRTDNSVVPLLYSIYTLYMPIQAGTDLSHCALSPPKHELSKTIH